MDNTIYPDRSGDLASISAPSGGGNPPESSIHPNYDLQSRGAQAPNTSQTDAVGGVGATAGAVTFSQLVNVETSTEPLGGPDPMAEGLGTPPRP